MEKGECSPLCCADKMRGGPGFGREGRWTQLPSLPAPSQLRVYGLIPVLSLSSRLERNLFFGRHLCSSLEAHSSTTENKVVPFGCYCSWVGAWWGAPDTSRVPSRGICPEGFVSWVCPCLAISFLCPPSLYLWCCLVLSLLFLVLCWYMQINLCENRRRNINS